MKNNSVDLGNREENKNQRKVENYNMYKYSLFLTIAAIMFYCLTHLIFLVNFIPSTSMESTLKIGDVVVGTCDTSHIERYDIIVFYPPLKKDRFANVKYVKRVIGLPGETIEVKDNQVYADGVLLDDSFINEPMVSENGTYVIPEGQYFVMGDNRNHSIDARFWNGEYVKEKDILSVEKVIIYPFNRINNINYN